MQMFHLDSRLTKKLLRRFLIPSIAVRALYFKRFRALVSPRAEVDHSPLAQWGRGCIIASFTKVKIDGPFEMGKRVHIGTGCFVGVGPGGVFVGDNVMISPNCVLIASNYRYDRLDVPLHEQGSTSKGIRIGRNSWLGAGACVLDGAEIGDNVIVAAGSVVSGKIADNAIVQGNPARVIFTRR